MDKQKVHDFLKSHPIGVLATTDTDRSPYATTIYFVVDEELNIKFMSKRDTQKIQNIEKNNKVMLVVYEPKTQTNVQIIGMAEDISKDQQARQVFLDILEISRETSKSEVPPFSKMFAGGYAAFMVKPKQIKYSVYQPGEDAKSEFTTIDF